jgi:hypothetical protein
MLVIAGLAVELIDTIEKNSFKMASDFDMRE